MCKQIILMLPVLTRKLAIADRSCISCTHNMLRASNSVTLKSTHSRSLKLVMFESLVWFSPSIATMVLSCIICKM